MSRFSLLDENRGVGEKRSFDIFVFLVSYGGAKVAWGLLLRQARG